MKRLGFVQADPIRCPARAQDLILRHRVKNYRAGDLERSYPGLGLEECYLYAYGFLSKDLWRIVHPKTDETLTSAEQEALELIARHGPMHPKELEAHVGGERTRNCWGGFSRTAKMAMESLHDRGALRVARRDKGFRIYETADGFEQILSKEERFEEIIVATLKAMGAMTRKFLLSELSHFGNLVESVGARRQCLQGLIDSGRVRVDLVDAVEYVSLDGGGGGRRKSDGVRILAPFDPIVRDRTRFEHLWGWTYRFEAYTPKSKRKLGYYAMPVLWRERIVGWANAAVEAGRLTVNFGYVTGRPDGGGYREAAELEVVRLARFLGLEESCFKASI
jgi:uncharacterized protein YcaQ